MYKEWQRERRDKERQTREKDRKRKFKTLPPLRPLNAQIIQRPHTIKCQHFHFNCL